MIEFLRNCYHWIRDTTHNYDIQEDDDGVERHHDPYWFQCPEIDPSEHDQPAWYVQAKASRNHERNTDYDFPEEWGQMTPEQKDQWYLRQRVWRQINRQYDAGMWDQWDVETLRAGLTPREVAEEVHENENQYKFGDDD